MRTIRIGSTVIEMHDSGLTVTKVSTGDVPAFPPDDEYQLRNAQELGYGNDRFLASRDHELAHSLLAHWLGLPESPTLAGVAAGNHWPYWWREEAAVLALQGFARAAGVSLIEIAQKQNPE
jgi:hypothetical protein